MNSGKAKVTERNWSEHFTESIARRTPIDWTKGIHLDQRNREAIILSLQKFQVGESGEGQHLKKYAAQTGDAEYCRAIELFIAEENYHAQLLAQVLGHLNATLLESHWSDNAFIFIRRFSGLRTELMILLIAELIAKKYYRVLHDATHDQNLRAICLQILRDENAHVAFHYDTLSRAFASWSPIQRALLRFIWKCLYRLICRLVAWDHRGVLRASGVSMREWMRDTDAIFEQAATQIFAPQFFQARPVADLFNGASGRAD